MAARISLRSSYSPAARSCKRERPRREAGSPWHTVSPRHTVTHQFCQLFHIGDGFKLLGQGGQGHLLLLLQAPGPAWGQKQWAGSCHGCLGAKSPHGQLAGTVNRPPAHTEPLSTELLPPSHPLKPVQATAGPGIKASVPCSSGGGVKRVPSPLPDSPRPVLLVVLLVAAALWAEALGCQCLLVPLQLLPLQLPDGRADPAPLGQVCCCLQLGVTGQGSAAAPATASPWLGRGAALGQAAYARYNGTVCPAGPTHMARTARYCLALRGVGMAPPP